MKYTIIILISMALFAGGCGQSADKQTADDVEDIEVWEENAGNVDEFVETIGNYSFTELGLACYEGNLDAVKEMINNNADKERCLSDEIFEYDALYAAILFGHADIVEYLTGINENVNKIYNEDGATALSLACSIEDKNKALNISKILLDAGANVNGASDVGGDYIIYPIFRAIENDNIGLVQLLIDYEADLSVEDKQGNTAVDIAENNRQIKELIAMFKE